MYSEINMEQIVNLHIEKLPEGVYLATSDDVPGLVAQGRTVAETIEIARDVARILIEARASATPVKRPVGDVLDVSVVIAA
jgi:predicted RNase H-like HicB family nuclease